jgi:hypothetical protein
MHAFLHKVKSFTLLPKTPIQQEEIEERPPVTSRLLTQSQIDDEIDRLEALLDVMIEQAYEKRARPKPSLPHISPLDILLVSHFLL